MQHVASERIAWKKALRKESPLLLPVAHDALTARIIEQAGFAAVQIGGFAVEGSRHGVPDIDLTQFAERHAAAKDIMAATSLPIMVDADDGYGDAKNVTYTAPKSERDVYFTLNSAERFLASASPIAASLRYQVMAL